MVFTVDFFLRFEFLFFLVRSFSFLKGKKARLSNSKSVKVTKIAICF